MKLFSELRDGGRAFVESWRVVFDCYLRRSQKPRPGYGYSQVTFGMWCVAVFVVGPLFAFEQAYLCWWREALHLPWFPGVWAGRLSNRISLWVEAHSTLYRWVRPQIEGAIGFHWPCDGGEPPIVTPVLSATSYSGYNVTVNLRWNGESWTTPATNGGVVNPESEGKS